MPEETTFTVPKLSRVLGKSIETVPQRMAKRRLATPKAVAT